nr:TIGR00730 family Rossman fold protein [Sphingobacterium sp. T2]
MGAVADGALDHKGEVIGVIPHFLNSKEIGHHGVTTLITVDNMHQRKMKMNELSEAIIALPGGYGTMEELFEMITWGQLGLHQKPVAYST